MMITKFRLNLPLELWNHANGELSLGNRMFAFGKVRRNCHGHFCDLIVDRMKYVSKYPAGREFSTTYDWLILQSPTYGNELEIQMQIQSSAMRLGQMMVFVQPGLGPNFEGWIGVVVDSQQMLPLNEIRLIGPE